MNRFHTLEKITDYGSRVVLFKRGKKGLAWAEERESWNIWLYGLGIPSKKPKTYYWSDTYQEAESNILKILKDKDEVK